MKKARFLCSCWVLLMLPFAGNTQVIFEKKIPGAFAIAVKGNATAIVTDEADDSLVQITARLLADDIERVSDHKPQLTHAVTPAKNLIIIGTVEHSKWLQQLIKDRKLHVESIRGKWDAYQVSLVKSPFKNVETALVIAGSNKRGAAYGALELSQQMGVSPWYWWADVAPKKHAEIYLSPSVKMIDSGRVKYRGIFINDEAPAFSGWTKEKFGGVNHGVYEKVFELLLRLKGNFLWPAMWGNAFADDDSLNPALADKWGIVISTSHHEPMMRAHDEWRRYGKGPWDYTKNDSALRAFWRKGIERMGNRESVVTLAMRGDGDMAMSKETATDLLERIVSDQRRIIEEVKGREAAATPQVWALYKEVQDYYDKGMRVPDDVTLLLCDDNWGNIRRLPSLQQPHRKGGYGIYYHFDYVGGPRNYKWLNTNPLPRIWEQMHLAWEYDARQIWVVNVGDIKPMEFPISFFLEYAWNPDKIGPADIERFSTQWAAQQFGTAHAKDIAGILARYAKYNSRRKPELLDANTFSFNYNEWPRVVNEYKALLATAENIYRQIPDDNKAAYYQLVLHPVKACANLYEMYYNAALNKQAFAMHDAKANDYAAEVKRLYNNDSLITLEYHGLNNGKWNHMMSQTHIGYTYWQQPEKQVVPKTFLLAADSAMKPVSSVEKINDQQDADSNAFISIEAAHFNRAVNGKNVYWQVLPDLGRTGDAVTAFPVTASSQLPQKGSPVLEYNFETNKSDSCTIQLYFSPTLNVHNNEEGLQFAISLDDETPQVISINKEDKTSISGIWNQWVSNNIIAKKSRHFIDKPGKHVIKYWMVDAGVVLQKLVLDFGHVKNSYLGPPENKR